MSHGDPYPYRVVDDIVYRLFVSDDRCTLLNLSYDISLPVMTTPDMTATVATRDDPSHTWGPPVKLTEEKT